MSVFTIQHIFSLASRDRCMARMRNFVPMPTKGTPPKGTAAVLVPLCRVNGVPSLLYTVRADKQKRNTGFVTFPGGKTQHNESPLQTVIRKVQEDLGIKSDKINSWGQGPAISSRTNEYMITPVIGVIPELKPSDINVNKNEVAEAFTVPIKLLCEKDAQYYTQYSDGLTLPVFLAEQYKIWGFTAYMTHVFLSCALSKDVYQNQWLKEKIDLYKT